MVLVDGDGWALALVGSGRTAAVAATVPVHGRSRRRRGLAKLLGPETRIVLTDTNRRREVVPNRLTDAYGPLVPADTAPGPSIALSGPRRADGVAGRRRRGDRQPGGSAVRRQRQRRRRRTPSTEIRRPHGPSGTSVAGAGSRWRCAPRPVRVDRIDLDIPPTTGQRISQVEVQADDDPQEVAVPPDGRVSPCGSRAARPAHDGHGDRRGR